MKKEIDWIREEDEKPPYGVEVLCFVECTYCRDKIDHSHNLVWRGYPIHKPFLGIREKEDKEAIEYLKRKFPHRDVSYYEEGWHPVTPTYWAFIPDPYTSSDN